MTCNVWNYRETRLILTCRFSLIIWETISDGKTLYWWKKPPYTLSGQDSKPQPVCPMLFHSFYTTAFIHVTYIGIVFSYKLFTLSEKFFYFEANSVFTKCSFKGKQNLYRGNLSLDYVTFLQFVRALSSYYLYVIVFKIVEYKFNCGECKVSRKILTRYQLLGPCQMNHFLYNEIWYSLSNQDTNPKPSLLVHAIEKYYHEQLPKTA